MDGNEYALSGGLTGAIGMTAELAGVVEDWRVHHVGTYNGNPLGVSSIGVVGDTERILPRGPPTTA